MDVAESGGVVGRKEFEFRSRVKSLLCVSTALVPYCEAFASRIHIEESGWLGLKGMGSKVLLMSEVFVVLEHWCFKFQAELRFTQREPGIFDSQS
jgi:hypothetical protein